MNTCRVVHTTAFEALIARLSRIFNNSSNSSNNNSSSSSSSSSNYYLYFISLV
jgi:hypothetical protein